jgi:AraC family transcriptional regulator
LQNTNEKVIDIALKYGYQSADAFRVAFKRLHGVTPSEARNSSVTLTFYCRLSFEINIKGIDRMDYNILEKQPFKVIGIRKTTPYGGGTWAVVKSDGSNEKIKEISGKFFDLGLCFGFSSDGSNDYMCGIEWNGDTDADFDTYEYPAATWLRFEAKGSISEQVLSNLWYRIHHEFLTQSKYKICDLPTIEKYISWDDAADKCDVEIWIPVSIK